MNFPKVDLDKYPDVLEPKDIKEILNCGRDQAYNLLKSNQFHVVRCGRDYKVFRDVFFKWLSGV